MSNEKAPPKTNEELEAELLEAKPFAGQTVKNYNNVTKSGEDWVWTKIEEEQDLRLLPLQKLTNN